MYGVEKMSDAELIAFAHRLIDLEKLNNLSTPVDLATRLDPIYERREHLTVIGEAIAKLANGENDRLLITCPPRAGKSETASIWGTVWWLARHPAHRVVVASYGDDLAQQIGKKARSIITEHQTRLGIHLARGSSAYKHWTLASGGGLRSVGYGSGLTGHGADLLICDDPHKDRTDANSLTRRTNVWNWWSSTALTRLAPKAPVIMILTRWHPDDLAGRALKEEGTVTEGGRWLHVHMPALCTDPTNDPLHRAYGAPLPHPRIPADDLDALLEHWNDKRRTSIVSDWNALYQGDPQPAEGALIAAEMLAARRDYRPDTVPVKHAVAVDPSGGGRDLAGIIGGHLGADGRLYYTHDASLVGPAEKWARAACELAAQIDADRIIIESNYGGDMAKMVVQAAWADLMRENPTDPKYVRHAPRVELVHAKKGKLLRAEPIAQQIAQDRIRIGAPLPDMESEWATWQPDDAMSPGRIDASVYLAYALLPVAGSGAVLSSAVDLYPAGIGTSLVMPSLYGP